VADDDRRRAGAGRGLDDRPLEQAGAAADPERNEAACEGAEERNDRQAHRSTVVQARIRGSAGV
jgi:hypothetical protein